jgi:hypothetical protein
LSDGATLVLELCFEAAGRDPELALAYAVDLVRRAANGGEGSGAAVLKNFGT